MITVKPYGGLANRMRVIDTTLRMAGYLKKDLFVIWERSFEINCGFNKLFEKSHFHVKETTAGPLKKRILEKIPELIKSTGLKFPFGYDIVLVNKDIEEMKRNGSDFSFFDHAENIYIQTFQALKADHDFSWIKPHPDIAATVKTYTSSFTENTIGIHIRRTDNEMSIRHSPLHLFIEEMKREIEKNNDTRFFLATDSVKDEAELRQIFGERIISHHKILDRNNEQGIIDAAVDLFCLSSTKKIIGSHYSSFSEVASQIRNIELKQIFK